ncbi:type II secretion system protein [Rhodoferax sp.]|uniref:type II secretion system protein n=1 Tax=Rhodoferax sp. TaxID=50421 RepID=UPI001ED1CB0E|nr:type II secretion system protein [Rhodoferax sp.]MBT9507748.1 type II secretion system protein [Rhodoferax sp.]
MRRARGFTLIELVVTVAIVGILASIAVPLGEISLQRAKESELRSALRQIREALDTYKRAADEGRVQRRAGGSGYPRSLDELAGGVEDAKNPAQAKIFFLRRLPRDPFHPQPDVPAADTWGKRAYASPPDAPAEGDDVFDVYSRSERVGLNGTAYREW